MPAGLHHWWEPVLRWLRDTVLALPGGIAASAIVVAATYWMFRGRLRRVITSSLGIVGTERTLQALRDIVDECEAARTALREGHSRDPAARAIRLLGELQEAIKAVRRIERRSIRDAPQELRDWAQVGNLNAQAQLDRFLNEPASVVEGMPEVEALVESLQGALEETAADVSDGQQTEYLTRIERLANQAHDRLQTAQQTMDATLERFGPQDRE